MDKGLILVGAGPGDPELITVKGVKAIQKAKVLLYDALISKELLNYAPADCKLIYVGKRAGMHNMAQSKINSIILKYAQTHLVVRLKGGDPYVFGRGFEEITTATIHGINTQVIPGITSAIAGPTAAGIPVTTRNVSRSFWIVTATSSDHSMNKDLELAARSSATIIILMGMKKMDEVIQQIKTHRGTKEPVAIIQNATTINQVVTIGRCSDIMESFHKRKTNGPGIIVAGKVIEESKSGQLLVEKLKEHLIAA